MNERRWTVLIYADGNNDLAPEILAQMRQAGACYREDTAVLVQVGLEDARVVKNLRPGVPERWPAKWSGVRRYQLTPGGWELVSDLGRANMADPLTLGAFLAWGTRGWPGQHLMVILSGHGVSTVGMLPDLAGDLPFLMSIPDMGRVLGMYPVRPVDILILDTCDMGCLELAYELAVPRERAQYLITPYAWSPLEGMSYEAVLKALAQRRSVGRTVRAIMECFPWPLLAVRLMAPVFRRLKELAGDIAEREGVNASNYLAHLAGDPGYRRELARVVLNGGGEGQGKVLMPFAFPDSGRLAGVQRQLAYYRQVTAGDSCPSPGRPLVLSRHGVCACLASLNPCLPDEEIERMEERLAASKGWRTAPVNHFPQ